jgi:hypothetical protein
MDCGLGLQTSTSIIITRSIPIQYDKRYCGAPVGSLNKKIPYFEKPEHNHDDPRQ